MTRLRDIMTKDVITIAPELTIREAMSLLSSRHISGAPVFAGGKILGVVSATDLMEFAAELPGAPAERGDHVEMGEWTPREEIEEDGRELEPPGTFFTELWEDAGADAALRFAGPEGPEWNVLDEHIVEEAMTRAPICKLPGDTTLPAAAEYMRAHRVHRVLVMEQQRLAGIVTATDLANAIADHKVRERAYVFGDDVRFSRMVGERPPHHEPTLGDRLPPRGGSKEA